MALPQAVTRVDRPVASLGFGNWLGDLFADRDGIVRRCLRALRSRLPGSRAYKDEVIARARQQIQAVLFTEVMPALTRQLVETLSQQVIAPELERVRADARRVVEQAAGNALAAQANQWSIVARHYLSPGASLVEPLAERRTIAQCFTELQRRAPASFPVWRELFDVNEKVFDGFPPHSCSVASHPLAACFTRFLRRHLCGTVLDIGCGPQPIPLYLENYPRELMAGIDPILPDAPHPFTFVQTVAEFLPWPDATFDTVVVATSLDHIFLLDRALLEMYRVIKPTGRLVIWTVFSPGAARYDPYRADVRKVDPYHLFHFDRPWFEEDLGRYFVVDEAVQGVDGSESSFYCFQPRFLSR